MPPIYVPHMYAIHLRRREGERGGERERERRGERERKRERERWEEKAIHRYLLVPESSHTDTVGPTPT